MKISAVAFTDRGMQLGKLLHQKLNGNIALSLCGEKELGAWTNENFSTSDALIFIGTAEIAVRAIYPFVSFNTIEPSVVVLDELGKFAIPLLSGHLGGANELATTLADITECIPVITTASETENVFSVDIWAKSIGLFIANPEAIKYVSSKLLSGDVVHYDSVFPILGDTPNGIQPSGLSDTSDFSITYLSSVPDKVLHLVPPVLTLGIDCKKDTFFENIEKAYAEFLKECGCHTLAVREVCSIDLEAQEDGLIEFCKKNKLPFRVFTAEEISNAMGLFTSSISNCQDTDIDNVCERSAVLGSDGTLFVRKMAFDGISMALAIKEPCIS